MKAGLALNITGDPARVDADIVTEHLRLGDLAEPLGFASIFAFEHHFSDYLISPCPISLLSYFAGRTSHILLGTSVIVLPWHDPIQVAERILLLDVLSQRRGIYGVGRGRAISEFDGFALDREESLTRWEEGLAIIRQALLGQPICLDGRDRQIKSLALRPRPRPGSALRLFAPVATAASAERVGRAGLGVLVSSDISEEVLECLRQERRNIADGIAACAPIVFAPIFVAATQNDAENQAGIYLERDRRLAAEHYGTALDMTLPAPKPSTGRELVGSAASCLEKLRHLREISGTDHVVFELSFGAMPHALAEANMRRIAAEILPVIRTW